MSEREAQIKVARAELVKRILITVTALVVAVVLGMQFHLTSQVRATQQDGSPAVKAARDAAQAAESTNAQILDCLEPTGKCYKRSQQQTGNAVASINELSQYAAVCADRPGSQSLVEIRACIADLITASTPPPSP